MAFRSYIDFLSRKYCGKPAATTEVMASSLWEPMEVPEPVARKSAATSHPVTLAEWGHWQAHQRYALYKTAISKSQPEAFEKVLNELRKAKS
jgi:Conserved nitrate reductase-associated protein (Nitr_red_assoc)